MSLYALSCIAAFSPLVGAALAGFLGWKLGRTFAHSVTIASVAVSFAASPGAPAPGHSNTKALGQVLYTDYVYAFELAAVVLLVAIVSAIAITLRSRKETKYQDPAAQLSVKASERLKIVKGMGE